MNNEYTISNFNKVLAFIGAAILAVFAFVLLANVPGITNSVGALGPLALLALATFITVSPLKHKIIITEESITSIGVFKTKEFLLTEIKGIRFHKGYTIETKDSPPRKIRINTTEFADSEGLNAWLHTLANLDQLDHHEELNELLANTNLGNTTEERQAKLDNANQLAIAYNVGVVFIVMANIISGNAYIVSLAILYPMAGLPFIFGSGGLVKVLAAQNSPRYSITIGLIASIAILVFRAVADQETIYANAFWMPFLVVALIFGVAYYFSGGVNKEVFPKAIMIFLFGCVYSICAVTKMNSAYDSSPVETYYATVIGHYIQHSKGTHHYIIISPWGPKNKNESEEVSYRTYMRDTMGTPVTIHARQGALNMPWYKVVEE